MAATDILILLLLTAVAVIVVGPIIVREIKRDIPHRPSLGDLGGLARTPEDRAVIEEYGRLFPHDPESARRLFREHFSTEDQRERFAMEDQQDEERRAALLDRARTEPAVAEQLRTMLNEELQVWTTLLKDSRKKVKKDPSMQVGIANLEKWERGTRAQLAEVEALIRRHDGAA